LSREHGYPASSPVAWPADAVSIVHVKGEAFLYVTIHDNPDPIYREKEREDTSIATFARRANRPAERRLVGGVCTIYGFLEVRRPVKTRHHNNTTGAVAAG